MFILSASEARMLASSESVGLGGGLKIQPSEYNYAISTGNNGVGS